MMTGNPLSVLRTQFFRDYGMSLVLLLLGVLFSLLTIREQHPTAAEAGRQVAERILKQHGDQASAMVVARATAEDRQFAEAAAEHLRSGGITVLSVINGDPGDVRRAIDEILDQGRQIDAIAANDVSSRWNVYNRYESVGSERCVIPTPYIWPDFLKVTNLLGIANQTAIYAIIAVGMTMVIITGGIDLSVGSLVALSSVVSAVLIRNAGGADAGVGVVIAAGCAGVLTAALSGSFCGLMVTVFRVPAFLVSLSIMMMASGLAFRVSEGRSIADLPRSWLWAGTQLFGSIPTPVVLMLLLYSAAHIVMSRTVFGRYVYAIGGNPEAARLTGTPVKPVLMMVYTISGLLAGLGGIVQSSQLAAGDPKFGDMYELEVIAAVVVGGTSLMGGEGRMFGTLIGAFIIAVIRNGMNLTSVAPFNQKIVLGAVLLCAVLLDQVKRRYSTGRK